MTQAKQRISLHLVEIEKLLPERGSIITSLLLTVPLLNRSYILNFNDGTSCEEVYEAIVGLMTGLRNTCDNK